VSPEYHRTRSQRGEKLDSFILQLHTAAGEAVFDGFDTHTPALRSDGRLARSEVPRLLPARVCYVREIQKDNGVPAA
jgi:hypothetical protein